MFAWINRASPNTEICPFRAIQPAKQRERIETATIERASKCVTTGGRSGPPLRRVRQRNQRKSNPTSQVTRCGVECGMGVPQGVPKDALRYKKQNVRRHRHDRGTSTPRCALKQHPSKELQNALPREGAAALPYAEFVNATKTKAIQPAKQRDAH